MDVDNDGAGIGQVFQQLAVQMSNVLSALNVQGISQNVKVFHGNPKNFTDWIKEIKKYCKLTNLPEARKKLAAFQASKGVVSGYIQRYMDTFPQNTWNDLREQLAKLILNMH